MAFAETPANYELKIQPRPLGAALQELARQSGVQIVFMSRIAEGHDAPALNGKYTPEAALTALLNGTDLTFHRLNDRTIAVEPKAVVRKASDTTSSNSSLQPVSDSSVPRNVQATLRLAQGARSPAASPDSATADRRSVSVSSESDSASLREVVVTGSRIRRAVEDMPAPTNIVDAAAIEHTGLDNLADIMTRASQFGVGLGNNPGGDGANSADAGATFLNLRGMGTNRTLVLVNGLRRVSGTAASSAVDLSTIPAAMIDHVEVTTGGAAAVYGADAVTGVVNVILKHPTEGIDVAVRGGTSTRGDDKRLALSAVLGQKAERTEFSLGLSYSYEPLLHAEQRAFSRYNVSEFSNPNVTAASPYTNLRYSNWRFPGTSYGSAFVIGNTAYTIGENGALRPVHNDSTPYGPLGYLGIGGDGFNEADFDVLRLQSKIFSSLANFAYHFSDSLTFTTDLQLGHSSTAIPLQPNYEYSSISRDNPFVPAAVGALMDQYGLTQLAYGRTDVDQGISVNRGDRSTYTLVTKLDGDLGSAFEWDVAYQYGHFQGKSTLTHNRIGPGPAVTQLDASTSLLRARVRRAPVSRGAAEDRAHHHARADAGHRAGVGEHGVVGENKVPRARSRVSRAAPSSGHAAGRAGRRDGSISARCAGASLPHDRGCGYRRRADDAHFRGPAVLQREQQPACLHGAADDHRAGWLLRVGRHAVRHAVSRP
ncbi:MAG: TonB-dependent receptor plug domain-containing protein [Gammaproteobacteria bacterium]